MASPSFFWDATLLLLLGGLTIPLAILFVTGLSLLPLLIWLAFKTDPANRMKRRPRTPRAIPETLSEEAAHIQDEPAQAA